MNIQCLIFLSCVYFLIPPSLAIYKDCLAYKIKNMKAPSGIYTIQPIKEQPNIKLEVFCDMQITPLPWIVIQRRFGGFQSFAQSWKSYKYGFGLPDKEFWLGNEKIHLLTNAGSMRLRIDLWDSNDNHYYAVYSKFSIGSERQKYMLFLPGDYSGTAGDSLSYHNYQKFSTFDRDNDGYSQHCSRIQGNAGWWYKRCLECNLNGKYLKSGKDSQAGVNWFSLHGDYQSLKKVEMKIQYIHYYTYENGQFHIADYNPRNSISRLQKLFRKFVIDLQRLKDDDYEARSYEGMESQQESSSMSARTIGIIVGCVSAVLVVLGLCGVLLFCTKRKKAVAKEYWHL